jgi:hypothetical protein
MDFHALDKLSYIMREGIKSIVRRYIKFVFLVRGLKERPGADFASTHHQE